MNKQTVSHSKCKLCNAVKSVAELTDYAEGVGRSCIDESACKSRRDDAEKILPSQQHTTAKGVLQTHKSDA